MSEPRYREWILETIDSLRSRKARPDLERICRMVRRRHGSEPDRTRLELEKLIQDQAVLKVSYKGSISYRNAAKVQRKCRKKPELTPGATVKVQTQHANLENGDSAQSSAAQSKTEDTRVKETGQQCHPKPSKTPVVPRRGETIISPTSENRCISCGAEVCRNKACCASGSSSQKDSVAKDRLPRARVCNGTDKGDEETIKNGTWKKAGHGQETATSERDCYGANKTKTCGSANAQSKLRRKQKALIKHRLRVRTKRRRADPNNLDLGDRLVASVQSLEERNRGSVASSGPSPLSLKEILGFLSSQGRLSQEKLTRSKVKAVLERELAKGRLRRTRFGNITLPIQRVGAKSSARHLKSALMERRIIKRDDDDDDKEPVPMGTHVSENVEGEKETASPGNTVPHLVDQGTQVDRPPKEEAPSVAGTALTPPTCGSHHVHIQEVELEDKLDVCQQSVPWCGVSFTGGVPSPEGKVTLPPTGHTAMKQEWIPDVDPSICCQEGPATQHCDAGELQTNIRPQVVSLSVQGGTTEAVGVQMEESALMADQLAPDTAAVAQNPVRTSEDIRQPSFTCTAGYLGCKDNMEQTSDPLGPYSSTGCLGVPENVRENGSVDQNLNPDPSQWTVADVACYFSAAGFPEQATAFRIQEIDGKSLLLMQRSDVLTGLSIKLGPALKIYEHHVKMLQTTHFEDDCGQC